MVHNKIVKVMEYVNTSSLLHKKAETFFSHTIYPDGVAYIVEDSEFYNEKLSTCLDIKKEYQHWQSM